MENQDTKVSRLGQPIQTREVKAAEIESAIIYLNSAYERVQALGERIQHGCEPCEPESELKETVAQEPSLLETLNTASSRVRDISNNIFETIEKIDGMLF